MYVFQIAFLLGRLSRIIITGDIIGPPPIPPA